MPCSLGIGCKTWGCCEREQGGVVEGPLLDRGRAGGRGRGFLLVRRVRLRGNAVWTGSVSDGWMGTALPLIWAGVHASSRVRNRSSVCKERGRIMHMLCSRHAAGWLGLSRQLPLPTAEGFRHSVAVPHEMVLVLRGRRRGRKGLCFENSFRFSGF